MFRTDEPRKNDVILTLIKLGDQEDAMSHSWYRVSTGAYIFKNSGYLYVRGNKLEKAFAEGFFNGWKQALIEASP